jgi:2-oxoglutarate dehydrogenase complex dehydrogenase (E1) component-like enzyme
MGMPPDLRQFFESYRGAFNRLDAAAISAHYSLPSMLTDRRGQVVWTEPGEVLANMAALCEYYRSNGFQSAEFEPLGFIDQPPDHAVADLAWTVLRSGARSAVCFRTGYNVRRQAGEWRIVLCTAYDEVPFPD